MLINDIERYIALRRSLGFKLEKTARHLRAFARHAMEMGDTHIRIVTAMTWSQRPLQRQAGATDCFRKSLCWRAFSMRKILPTRYRGIISSISRGGDRRRIFTHQTS